MSEWNEYFKKICVSPYFISVNDDINFLNEYYESEYSYSAVPYLVLYSKKHLSYNGEYRMSFQ